MNSPFVFEAVISPSFANTEPLIFAPFAEAFDIPTLPLSSAIFPDITNLSDTAELDMSTLPSFANT